MARPLRPEQSEVPQHIVQRGNNRGACFFDDLDRLHYLRLLGAAALTHDVAVHTYVLMTNHVHLLLTPRQRGGVSALMQTLGRSYVPWFNKRHNRTGGLYEGRHKTRLVHTERYLLCCYRYIELNPVRASLVADPAAYRWSSFRANALGESNDLITMHPVFADLGEASEQRQARYRDFVSHGISAAELKAIRTDLTRTRGRPKKGSDDFF